MMRQLMSHAPMVTVCHEQQSPTHPFIQSSANLICLRETHSRALEEIIPQGYFASSDDEVCQSVSVNYGERISVIAKNPEGGYQDSDESKPIVADYSCSTRARCASEYADFLYQHEDLMVFNQGGEFKCARYEQTMCGKGNSQILKDALAPANNYRINRSNCGRREMLRTYLIPFL